MNKKSPYILLFLLVVFVYPPVFQSVHIVWHHKIHSVEKQPLGIDSEQHRILKIFTTQKSHFNSKCPVCEYQFQVKDQLSSNPFSNKSPELIGSISDKLSDKPLFPFLSNNSSRAPPLV